ncbi:Cilia-and flagella-associated protein 61 [Fasciola hepatica]|uniref:Cilia-and flagella-associated protein 61 n=1 Tax=Fasciola hepatica TaxID=6192 RepID=A0A4E0RFE9_FASHE|nr:Cilia-and flagella-associated protein 61 [Fasciola hepatica]
MQRLDELITIRRTEYIDIPQIEELITEDVREAFGRISLLKIIERSVLSLTLVKENKDIIGSICLYDYPIRARAAQESWEAWLQSVIGLPNIDAKNSLFAHLIVIHPVYEETLGMDLCKAIFSILFEVHNIFVMTENSSQFKIVKNSPFKLIEKKNQEEEFLIYVAYRHDVFPVLFARIASVEDNDDLAPLFNSQTDLLRKTYGNYYIAELVEAQNDSLKCVVVECERKAVGFISATTKVNLDLLNKEYDLDVFNGLRKPDEGDVTERPSDMKTVTVPIKQDESYNAKEEQATLQVPSDEVGNSSPSEPDTVDSSPWTRRHLLSEDYTAKSNRETFVPTYCGQPDAFAIQMYAIKPDFETRFIDMLPPLFDQFPGLNYAVISVPRMVPVFPMLRHFVHCRVRRGQDPPGELYVFHRAGLLRDLQVRRTRQSDTEQIDHLLRRMAPIDQALIRQDLKAFVTQGRDRDGAIVISFVAESMGHIIGLIIMREEHNIEWIRAHYDIEEFIYYDHHARNEHATLYHCVVAASFHCRREVFLREVLRLANKTCFYFRILPPYASGTFYDKATLITCLSAFYPVRPRRQIIFPPKETLGVKGPEDALLNSTGFAPAICLTTPKLLTEQRVLLNVRIIVVGASTTGLAVLETLAGCSYINFSNVVLLSEHGLPGDTLELPDKDAEKFLTEDHCFPINLLGQLALRLSVHVIHGKLTAIDRKFKKITIDGERSFSYDYLVITTGLQYHACCPNGADISQMVTTSEAPYLPNRRFSVEFPNCPLPRNLFLINNIHDATKALRWVRTEYLNSINLDDFDIPEWKKKTMQKRRFDSQTDGFGQLNTLHTLSGDASKQRDLIVVYGYNLDAYACVGALLNAGVPGECIAMIHPPRHSHEKPAFEDPEVERVIHTYLAESEIQLGRNFSLARWNDSHMDDVETIEQLAFTSEEKPLKLNCKALFCFHEKTVDYDLFNATNNACLVFDSRLVIDINFHTNDPAIRAAGPVTKLQRIYYNDLWRHELGNSREVGNKLGQQLLRLFNPCAAAPPCPTRDGCHLLPDFEQPKVVSCELPGGYHYLSVTKPALYEPLEKRMIGKDFGRLIKTGRADQGNGYFSLHINQYNLVQSVVCLSKKPFPASNYIRLYNLHERLFNNLVSRFDEGLIPDLFEFFNDVWPLAIYHDRFDEFLGEVRDLLITCPPNVKESLAQKVLDMLVETGEVKPSEIAELKALYEKDGYKRAVEQRLLKFIHYNYNLLPMYAKPDLV